MMRAFLSCIGCRRRSVCSVNHQFMDPACLYMCQLELALSAPGFCGSDIGNGKLYKYMYTCA